MRISDWSSDVCSSDLVESARLGPVEAQLVHILARHVDDEMCCRRRQLALGEEGAEGRLGRPPVGARKRARGDVAMRPLGLFDARQFALVTRIPHGRAAVRYRVWLSV